MQPTRLLSAATAEAARYRHSIARRAVLAAALAVAALTAACGSDSATGPTKTQVAGTYPMATVRGLSVPRTFTDPAGSKLTIEGGSLTIKSDGTYELNYKGRLNSLTFNLTDEGNYALSGAAVSFTPDDGDPGYTGRVNGKSMLVDGFKIAGVKFDLGFAGN